MMRQTILNFAGPPKKIMKDEDVVINIRSSEIKKRGFESFTEWLSQPNSLYIGREVSRVGAESSMWANPFSVERYGRNECLRMYEQYVRSTPYLWNVLEDLDRKQLGCWCKPERCHGDVLLEMLSEKKMNHNS
jgi:hypothetical protein